jgi:hypothetical protein
MIHAIAGTTSRKTPEDRCTYPKMSESSASSSSEAEPPAKVGTITMGEFKIDVADAKDFLQPVLPLAFFAVVMLSAVSNPITTGLGGIIAATPCILMTLLGKGDGCSFSRL